MPRCSVAGYTEPPKATGQNADLLVYDTTATQMKQVLADLEGVLREHPGVWKDEITVRFLAFAESSLDIEIICWFSTPDMVQFRTWRQEVLLAFMEVVERAKTSFAFPTRTVHVVGDRKVG